MSRYHPFCFTVLNTKHVFFMSWMSTLSLSSEAVCYTMYLLYNIFATQYICNIYRNVSDSENCLPAHILWKLSQNVQISNLRHKLRDFKDQKKKKKSSGIPGPTIKLIGCMRKFSSQQSSQEQHIKEGRNRVFCCVWVGWNRVTADIISNVKMRPYWSAMTSVPIRTEETQKHRHRRGQRVTAEAKLPAKECQRLWAKHQKLLGGKDRFSLTSYRGIVALPTIWFQASNPQNEFCCLKPASLWHFVKAALGN